MKLGQLAQFAFVLLAAAAVYLFVSMAKDAESRRSCVPLCAMHPNYAGDNRSAPDFELSDMQGAKVRLSQFRGKTVLLNFWTKTCGPCLEEMPSLADLAKVLAPRKDVVLLTVSTDGGPDAVMSTLQTVLKEKPPFSLRVLFDPEGSVVADKYGTHLFPETWVIDPDGIIRARFDGARDWSNSLVLDVIKSVSRPQVCDIEFHAGVPSGPQADVCEESGSAS